MSAELVLSRGSRRGSLSSSNPVSHGYKHSLALGPFSIFTVTSVASSKLSLILPILPFLSTPQNHQFHLHNHSQSFFFLSQLISNLSQELPQSSLTIKNNIFKFPRDQDVVIYGASYSAYYKVVFRTILFVIPQEPLCKINKHIIYPSLLNK